MFCSFWIWEVLFIVLEHACRHTDRCNEKLKKMRKKHAEMENINRDVSCFNMFFALILIMRDVFLKKKNHFVQRPSVLSTVCLSNSEYPFLDLENIISRYREGPVVYYILLPHTFAMLWSSEVHLLVLWRFFLNIVFVIVRCRFRTYFHFVFSNLFGKIGWVWFFWAFYSISLWYWVGRKFDHLETVTLPLALFSGWISIGN